MNESNQPQPSAPPPANGGGAPAAPVKVRGKLLTTPTKNKIKFTTKTKVNIGGQGSTTPPVKTPGATPAKPPVKTPGATPAIPATAPAKPQPAPPPIPPTDYRAMAKNLQVAAIILAIVFAMVVVVVVVSRGSAKSTKGANLDGLAATPGGAALPVNQLPARPAELRAPPPPPPKPPEPPKVRGPKIEGGRVTIGGGSYKLMELRQYILDVPELVDKPVAVKGTIRTSQDYTGGYREAAKTHYAYAFTGAKGGSIALYMPRGARGKKLNGWILDGGSRGVDVYCVITTNTTNYLPGRTPTAEITTAETAPGGT